MTIINSGTQENMLYSVSRWTDAPGTPGKWRWFKNQFQQGHMMAVDPRTAVPSRWSLAPADVLGFVFWTRKPAALIEDRALLDPYRFHVHYTLTGWSEVEHGAPDIHEGLEALDQLVQAFGPERVTWRFSPIPTVPDVVDRFEVIATIAALLKLPEVYVAFLQENDLMQEPRERHEREQLLRSMAARSHGLKVRLCQEDTTLTTHTLEPRLPLPRNLDTGVCEDGKRYLVRSSVGSTCKLPKESCGCALAVDPFTINESCGMGCAYCYAADRSLAPRKRNTT